MTTKWREAKDVPANFATRLHFAGYRVWTRLMDGDVLFRLEKDGVYPNRNAGGYRWLDTACKMKGVRV